MNILEAIEDRNLFGQLFKDPASWATWRVFLRGLFGLPMEAAELETFKQFTGRSLAPGKQAQEAFAIVGRRGGKSYMAAVTACYLALFRDWKPYLSPGETGHILIIATDRVQARNIFGYVRAILSLGLFKSQVTKELDEEIRLKNQVAVRVATCDFRTLRGYTIVCAVCDEMAFWRSEGMNPAQEILTALRPALATVPGSLLLGISSPYSKSGPLYDNFRARFGVDDPDVLVWKAPTKAMNPTISDKLIDRALKEDYSAGKAEWLAEFREDLETFLTTELIESAVVPGRFEIPRLEDVQYYAFVDSSSGRADSFVLAIAHMENGENGRVVLDRIEEKRPPFAPQDAARELSAIMKEYGCYECTGDKYAIGFVVKAFEDCEIVYHPAEMDKSKFYLELEPLLAQGRVDLLDNKKLFNELRGLERRTRSGGRDSVDHGPGCHDDVANAAAGACVLASKNDMDPRRWEVRVI